MLRILNGEGEKYFADEIHQKFKHKEKGVVAMANEGQNLNGSRVWGKKKGRGEREKRGKKGKDEEGEEGGGEKGGR